MSAQVFKGISVAEVNKLLIEYKLRDPNTPTPNAGGSKPKKIEKLLKQPGGKDALINLLKSIEGEKAKKKGGKPKPPPPKPKPKPPVEKPKPKPKKEKPVEEDKPTKTKKKKKKLIPIKPQVFTDDPIGFTSAERQILSAPDIAPPMFADKFIGGEFDTIVLEGIMYRIDKTDNSLYTADGKMIAYLTDLNAESSDEEELGSIEDILEGKVKEKVSGPDDEPEPEKPVNMGIDLDELDKEDLDWFIKMSNIRFREEKEYQKILKQRSELQKIVDSGLTKKEYEEEQEKKNNEELTKQFKEERRLRKQKQIDDQKYIKKYRRESENIKVEVLSELYEYVKERFGIEYDDEDLDLVAYNVFLAKEVPSYYSSEDWWDTRGILSNYFDEDTYIGGYGDALNPGSSAYKEQIKEFGPPKLMGERPDYIKEILNTLKLKYKTQAKMGLIGRPEEQILYDSEDEEELARKPELAKKFGKVEGFTGLGQKVGLAEEVVERLFKEKEEADKLKKKQDWERKKAKEKAEILAEGGVWTQSDEEEDLIDFSGLEIDTDFTTDEDTDEEETEEEKLEYVKTIQNQKYEDILKGVVGDMPARFVQFQNVGVKEDYSMFLDEDEQAFIGEQEEKKRFSNLSYDEKYEEWREIMSNSEGFSGFNGALIFRELYIKSKIGLPENEEDIKRYFPHILSSNLSRIKQKTSSQIKRLIEDANRVYNTDDEEEEEEFDFNDPKWDMDTSDEEEEDIQELYPTYKYGPVGELFEGETELDIDTDIKQLDSESGSQFTDRLKDISKRIAFAQRLLEEEEDKLEKEEEIKQQKIEANREAKAQRFLQQKEREKKRKEEERKKQERERER